MEARQDKIYQKLMEHLFANTAKAISFTLILTLLIIGYIYIEGLTENTVLQWLAVICILLIFRILVALFGLKNTKYRQFTFITLIISGVLLGSFLGYFYWTYFYLLDLSHRMILLLFLVGLTAGSTISMAGSTLSFITFTLPIYIPIMGRNFLHADSDSHLIGLVIVIFMGFILVIFTTNRKMLRDNIELLVHQSELNEQLEQFNHKLSIVSITDDLTKLANRRYFQERLISDWIRAKRARIPVSLLIIDIDYFKACNDNYGHLYGDECLKEIADLLARAIRRKTDLAARYGGDEFVVILYDTSKKIAEKFAHRLQKEVKKLAIKNTLSKASQFLTVSIGVASSIPDIDDDYVKLFEQADMALYEAKQRGRKLVVVYQ